jgi:radical SAM family uncharacterized protein
MNISPNEIIEKLNYILPRVSKPGRYTGGELNQVVKDWETIPTKVALVFPDIYDLGMSNYGLSIFYDILNSLPDVLAERTFSPWVDMEEKLREHQVPLFSLESKNPISNFDIVALTLPYETLYTNALNILDLSGIPIMSTERRNSDPLVIAGGHGMLNPEPMHAFLDAIVIGEGEEVIVDIVKVYQDWKEEGGERDVLLQRLSKVWGVYVPSLYNAHYEQDGTLSHIERLYEEASFPIVKRILAKLPPPTTNLVVPYIDTVHNRIPIEITRGCTRGCRFCQAGMITRPVRERPVEEVLSAIEEAMDKTGYEEVGLLSLSSSDYTHVLELVKAVSERFGERALSVSLPSLRIESFSVDLMDALKDTRRSGFTLAPEAATERMRKIINKPVETQQLLDTAEQIYKRGWTNIKLYFMIGHPEETIEDVQAIIDVCKAVRDIGTKTIGRKSKVTAGVSTFIPKPHTPFQWSPCDQIDQILEKQELLRTKLKGPGLKLNWNNPQETILESALSRGDRRLSEVIYLAWKSGAKFDAWGEHFNFDYWMNAFEQTNLDPAFYTHRERLIDEALPWDHIDSTIRKKFLTQDYLMSKTGETRVDCRERCFACGILPTFKQMRMDNPGDIWKCPEVKTKSARRVTSKISKEEIQVI